MVALTEDNKDEIESMEDPRVLEGDELEEMIRAAAQVEVLRDVVESREELKRNYGS